MTKEEKLARKQQRKAEKVGLGKLLLWNSSSCSVALSTLMLGYATFYCTDVLQLAPALVGTLFMVSKIFDSFTDVVAPYPSSGIGRIIRDIQLSEENLKKYRYERLSEIFPRIM